jgi:hypoxanthine phosphoribosyltransferase
VARRFKCELVSWGKTYALTRRLAVRILQQSFRPDFVVAIGRGGFVPARILCDFLAIGALTAIKIEHWAKGAKKQEKARLRFPLNVVVSGAKVLVVDDVTDTGDTLRAASEYLQQQQPAEMRTAVIHHKSSCQSMPDFFGQKIVKWRWVIYPWAVFEDLTGFIEQMDPAPATIDDADKRLIADYGLRVPRRLLRDVWLVNQGKTPEL